MGQVYTRTGDGGETSLGNRERVSKDSPRVELYGVIDEANAALGLARSVLGELARDSSLDAPREIAAAVSELQDDMTRLMSRISLSDQAAPFVSASELERRIELVRAKAPMPNAFVSPGGSQSGAALHLARASFRRAERRAVALARAEGLDAELLKTINRISDYAFALSVWADQEERVARLTKMAADVMGRENDGPAPAGRAPGGKAPDPARRGDVTLAEARELIAAMEWKAAELGVPMVMAVCDSRGALVAFAREEEALPASVGLAAKKAFTAAQLRRPTSELAGATQPGASLWGVQGDPDFVVFGGGYPLTSGGRCVGAVGASGGSTDEDMSVARAALDSWYKHGWNEKFSADDFQ
jgi:ATP:cob(I)alamin adenosyltransferase